MEEIWIDIKGYEGLYQVSNLGRVKSLSKYAGNSLRKEKILKNYKDKDGYVKVILCKNNKTRFLSIHRLIAEAFIPNPDNLPQINHKDECKSNNSIDNLEWCSCKYNINYGNRTKKAIITRKHNKLSYGRKKGNERFIKSDDKRV